MRNALNQRHARKLLDSLSYSGYRNSRNAVIVTLALTQGLRAIEIRRLDWEDVDFETRQLAVLGKGKTVKVRVPMTERSRIALKTFRPLSDVSARGAMIRSVSHNSMGRRLSTRSVRQFCKDALAEVGFEQLDAHSLRHSFACIALDNGLGVADIQRLLRHQDIRTTYRYLVHAGIDESYAATLDDAFSV